MLFNYFRSEDANKAFSQAVQMHDSLVKAWALWGDYLDNLFIKDRFVQVFILEIVLTTSAPDFTKM